MLLLIHATYFDWHLIHTSFVSTHSVWFVDMQVLGEREKSLKVKEEELRSREDEETKRQILFGRMLDERRTREETEISEERQRLEQERLQLDDDYQRYEAAERVHGSRIHGNPGGDYDSAYSSSRDSVSIYV